MPGDRILRRQKTGEFAALRAGVDEKPGDQGSEDRGLRRQKTDWLGRFAPGWTKNRVIGVQRIEA
ncbi:MAG: hypothetical protein LBD06_04895 [Candidatus Accumulibacter sp.]|nr:hypothetical protein [Accumulibacter sp.]